MATSLEQPGLFTASCCPLEGVKRSHIPPFHCVNRNKIQVGTGFYWQADVSLGEGVLYNAHRMCARIPVCGNGTLCAVESKDTKKL